MARAGSVWVEEVVIDVVADGVFSGDTDLFVVGLAGGRDDDALVQPPAQVHALEVPDGLALGAVGEAAELDDAAEFGAAVQFNVEHVAGLHGEAVLEGELGAEAAGGGEATGPFE